MDEKRRKDVIRYTFQSYLGKNLRDMVITEHQKIAINRMNSMKEDRFNQLCLDLINEIHRRNNMNYEPPNELGAKLLKISEQKFKNLVMETLTVFYMRNTQYMQEDTPEFLENMTALILDLKNCADVDSFLCQLDGLSFYNKIYEFLEFIKRKGIAEQVVVKMKETIDQRVERDAVDFIESLNFPERFLETLIKSEFFEKEIKSCPVRMEQFQVFHKNISSANLFENANIEKRSNLIKQNMSDILSILVGSISIPSKKIEYFETELLTLVQILELVEKEIKYKNHMDLNEASLKLSEILNSIVSKGSYLAIQNLNDLKIQQVSVELINSSVSRDESFKLVLDIAKDIRKALSCI